MGIIVSVYRQAPYNQSILDSLDTTNGGESSYHRGFTVTNCEGPFEPSAEYPAAELVMAAPIHGRKILRLIPESVKGEWTMFGGNYASTSDSRFSKKCEELLGVNFYGAVAIHDRVENRS